MSQKSKTAFIIPAAGQKSKQLPYQQIGEIFKKQGITPVFIDINWRMRLSIEDCAEEAEKQIREVYEQNPESDLYFFGFSLGANVAHILAGHYEAKAQILASMLPHFREDIPYLNFWKRLTANFFIYPGADKPKYPKAKLYQNTQTLMLIGENEGRTIPPKVVEQRLKLYPKSELVKIIAGKHLLEQAEYISTIAQQVQKLH